MRQVLTAEMTAIRQQEIADGVCPAEHLTDRDVNVLQTDIPWACSLDAGHDGDHEVWVFATFTDERPDHWYRCHTWS